MNKITEKSSNYRHLEKMSIEEITKYINKEDQTVAIAIEKALPAINNLINVIVKKIKDGGRLFYVGAGSGGRLSVLDVIELPTTFGVPNNLFNVILAGGKEHLIEALEEKEDDTKAAWTMLKSNKICQKDIVIGISASGTTPFVLSALKKCKSNNISTACIVSNPNSIIATYSDYVVEVITGPEFISGSTRMKCGTAQKMIFDMISTTTMIQLGRVQDNQMIHVKPINNKIMDRAIKILMSRTKLKNYELAKTLLLKKGNIKEAEEYYLQSEQNKKRAE